MLGKLYIMYCVPKAAAIQLPHQYKSFTEVL